MIATLLSVLSLFCAYLFGFGLGTVVSAWRARETLPPIPPARVGRPVALPRRGPDRPRVLGGAVAMILAILLAGDGLRAADLPTGWSVYRWLWAGLLIVPALIAATMAGIPDRGRPRS